MMNSSKKILGPSSANKVRGKENKEQKPETSTPVRESTFDVHNISHISSTSNTSSRTKGHHLNEEKENLHGVQEVNGGLVALKTVILNRSHLFEQQKESLQEMNRQIAELREKLEQEKQEVHATINALKEISYIEKRYHNEKEIDSPTSESDMQLQQHFDQLMTAVNHERCKLELKNISFISEEQFKKLVSEADSSIKSFHENGEFETVQKLASFLPTLEESIEKCNASSEKCAEITESIKRLILHRATLRSIDDASKASV